MSETPETDKAEDRDPMMYDDWAWIVPANFARRLERERDEARRELAETISCIEQAIDHHKGHQHFNSVFALMNLLDNINKRRKHDPI